MGGNKSTTVPTRQAILSAATRVITRKGFNGSKLSEIAEEAGVTEPTIYLNFKGKESLLFSIAEEHMARYLLFLDEHQQGISGAHNKLRKLVWAHLWYSDANREFMSAVLFECRNNRRFYQSGAYKLFRKYAGILSSILEEGMKEKVFRPDMSVLLVRDIIFGLMDYEAIRFFVTKEKPGAVLDHGEIMQLLDNMLLRKHRVGNRPADKKQRILEAAVQAFSRKGYAEVTIAEIAGKAEVASGTIYEYFKNKEDLLLSIAEDHFKEDLKQLRETFNGSNTREKLSLFMQYLFQQYLDDPNFVKVFLSMVQYNSRFYKSRAYKSQYKYVAEIEKMVQKIFDEGGVRNVNIRIFRNMFFGALTHMAVRWFLVDQDRDYAKMEEIREVTGLLSDAVSVGISQA